MTPSRRRLLLGGAALVGVAAVGGAVEVQPSAPRAPREPLRVLSPRSFSALAAVADRVIPPTEGLPTAWELRVPEKVDALLDALPPGAGAELHGALLLLESPVVGLATGGRPRPFSRLDGAAQDAVLAAWRDSASTTRRGVWKATVGLVKSAYWSDPAVDVFLGYARLRFPT